jgi:hypothetical protein
MNKNNVLQLAKNVEEIEALRILSKKEMANLNKILNNKNAKK